MNRILVLIAVLGLVACEDSSTAQLESTPVAATDNVVEDMGSPGVEVPEADSVPTV